jgi:general secretion pathway protein M
MTSASDMKLRWARLAPREQRLVLAAGLLVAAALLWWLALAPALAVLRSAPAQHLEIDAQLQHMLALQAQARALQSQPRLTPDEASRLLEASVRERLGTTARMSIAGERVSLTLAGTPPEALAQWLGQARTNARALPSEAHLVRNPGGLWDGTLVLALPPR